MTLRLNDPALIGGMTPPIVTDPYFSSVVGLYHMDSAVGVTNVIDSSGNSSNINKGTNGAYTSAQAKFGAGSLVGTSDGRYFYGSPTNGTIGTQDFTVEGWIYLTALPGSDSYIYTGYYSNQSIRLSSEGKIRYYSNTGSAPANAVTLNAWNHFAISRTSGVLGVYLNGTRGASTVNETSNISVNQHNFGSDRLNAGSLPAYYDEIRITIGVGRYTGATLTVPTAAFPNS